MTVLLPRYVYLTADAVEAIDELHLGDLGHLEQGGILIGEFEPKRNRVVIEQIRRNLFVEPYSPNETVVDGEAMALYEQNGVGRVAGSWHTHTTLSTPVRASDADIDTWKRSAVELEQDVYVGLVIGPTERWESGFPAHTWEEVQMGAWVASRHGQATPATIQIQPRWLADLRSQVRFREVSDAT